MEEERKSKMFWVVHEGIVRHLKGLECAFNTNTWFFPDIGFSCVVGYHAFETERDAVIKALTDLNKKREEIEEKIAKLSSSPNIKDRANEAMGCYDCGNYIGAFPDFGCRANVPLGLVVVPCPNQIKKESAS